MKRTVFVAIALALSGGPALAGRIDQLQNASQAELRLLSEDLGAALSYKPLAPAEALGITGFDIGIAVTATDLEHSNVLEKVTSSSAYSTAIVPSLHLTKGLPFGIDVGARYTRVPKIDVALWGFHVKYTILDGGSAMPALAARGVARPPRALVHRSLLSAFLSPKSRVRLSFARLYGFLPGLRASKLGLAFNVFPTCLAGTE
jgi:hypothetical protein